MSDKTLEAAADNVVQNETSTPAEEVKQEVEQGNEAEVTKDAEDKPEADQEPEETVETLRNKLKAEREAFEKRIGRKTAATKSLEEEVQSLREQVQSLSSKATDDTPNVDDFDNYEDYEKAVVEHKAKQLADERVREAKQKELQEITQRQEMEKKRLFEARENEFRAQNPEYDEAATELQDALNDMQRRGMDIRNVGRMVVESEKAPQLIMELAKDTGLVEELIRMEPYAAMREIVNLELGLTNTTREVKRAPEPIKAVKGQARGKKSLDDMTYDERNAYFASLR